jgi:hypothetical protein
MTTHAFGRINRIEAIRGIWLVTGFEPIFKVAHVARSVAFYERLPRCRQGGRVLAGDWCPRSGTREDPRAGTDMGPLVGAPSARTASPKGRILVHPDIG